MLRHQKLNSTDIFIIALATSDILFVLAIHPMLIAASFGADVELLFSSAGLDYMFLICLTDRVTFILVMQLVWIWSSFLWVY